MFIEGNVRFDVNRTGAMGTSAPFPSVPIALQDVGSGSHIGAITGTEGTFRFNNVPDGNYAVIVYWGCPIAVPSPADWGNTVPSDPIKSVTPPITTVVNPPPYATNLDFLSQSSYFVTVNGADVSNINFMLGPVHYTPINVIPSGVTIVPGNLIMDGDSGTFGSFEQGSIINRGAMPSPPYPGLVPEFTYVMPDPAEFVPDDGEYGIQNVMTNNRSNGLGSWWRVSDHTTGNETGRFMLINGYEPGASFFKTTVRVKPDAFYMFLGWILDIYRSTAYAPPQFGVRVSDKSGVIYYASLGSLIPVTHDMPAWKQIGVVVHTEQYTQLTIEFISEAPAAWGNDYCLDDVSLNEILLPEALEITKEADKDCVLYDQDVTFTVKVKNLSDADITDIHFKDKLPPCLSFSVGSVVVAGESFPSYDPTVGWAFDLAAHQETIISFKAKVTCRPSDGIACNLAEVMYAFEVIEGSPPADYRVYSEPVCIRVPQVYKHENGDIRITPPYKGGAG